MASIDMLRGLVIIITALEHVRDYFHYKAYLLEPVELTQTHMDYGSNYMVSDM